MRQPSGYSWHGEPWKVGRKKRHTEFQNAMRALQACELGLEAVMRSPFAKSAQAFAGSDTSRERLQPSPHKSRRAIVLVMTGNWRPRTVGMFLIEYRLTPRLHVRKIRPCRTFAPRTYTVHDYTGIPLSPCPPESPESPEYPNHTCWVDNTQRRGSCKPLSGHSCPFRQGFHAMNAWKPCALQVGSRGRAADR